MNNNDFYTNTQKSFKKEFLNKITGVFIAALFLTGLCSIGGFFFLFRGISEKVWSEIGIANFTWRLISFTSILCTFISLIKIAIDEKPFSKTLTCCLRIIALLFFFASFLLPRLSGYQPSGFALFSAHNFVLIDGSILMTSLLLLILSSLIQAGFAMQREIDEML